MNEWEDKLNQVLSSPDTMEQIMSLAQSLSGGATSPSPPQTTATPSSPTRSEETSLLSMLNNDGNSGNKIDPRITNILVRIMAAWNKPDDQRTTLLYALRPFFKSERAEKIQRAAHILKLSYVIRVALDALKGGDIV